MLWHDLSIQVNVPLEADYLTEPYRSGHLPNLDLYISARLEARRQLGVSRVLAASKDHASRNGATFQVKSMRIWPSFPREAWWCFEATLFCALEFLGDTTEAVVIPSSYGTVLALEVKLSGGREVSGFVRPYRGLKVKRRSLVVAENLQ